MRNLKKVLAVVLTVALLAAMMTVPALAAVSYEDEALKLQTIGLFAGEPADLKLEEGVTRVQGLAFAIRAAGKEDEALAMSDADVATELAKFTDAATVPAWAKKYTAYAIKNGITVGVGNNKLAPLENISGTSFLVFVLKSGMGYSSVTTANVVDKAVEAKVITAAQAVAFGGKAALIRDDAAAILYGAAKNGINADGKTFIQSLIDAGAVDPEDAADAGFIEDTSKDEAEVKSVKALNLIQIEVELSNTNYDEDEVEDESNYEFDGDGQDSSDDFKIKSAEVDGTTLIITLGDNATPIKAKAVKNQTEGTLKIDDKVFGKDLEFEDIDFTDNELPVIENAEVIGKDTVKFYFSEPMDIESDDDDEFDFELDGKSFSPKKITSVDDGYEANVTVYGTFTDGTLKVEVDNGLKDYAGFTAKATDFELDVVKDEEPPVVTGFKDASENEVTLIFDQDIDFVGSPDKKDFYHTNEENYVEGIDSSDLDGNELTLRFAEKKELPDGKAYVYIKSGAVKDLWGNENDFIRYEIEVIEDEEKPTVKDIDVVDAKTIDITFSEKLDKESAEDEDNYVLTDDDDDEVAISKAAYTEATKVVRLTLRSPADDGVYELTISDVEDKAGNKMDEYSEEIELDDEQGPKVKKVYADGTAGGDEWDIYVQYSEAVATDGTYAANDLYKYELTDASDHDKTYNLGQVDEDDKWDVSIKMIDDNETAKISIDGFVLVPGSDTLSIARIADKSGDRSALVINGLNGASGSGLPIVRVDDPGNDITITDAVATDRDKIEVEFSGNLDDYEFDDFMVGTTTTPDLYAIDDIDIVDGDEIIIWLEEDLPTTDTTGISVYTQPITNPGTPQENNPIGTENSFGILLAAGEAEPIDDELAPEVKELSGVDTNKTYVNREAGDDDEDDVPSVYAVFDGTKFTIKVEFTEDIQSIPQSLITVTADGDEVGITTSSVIGNVLTIEINTTDENVIMKGDNVDIDFVTDGKGNSVPDLKLNIEYEVQLPTP